MEETEWFDVPFGIPTNVYSKKCSPSPSALSGDRTTFNFSPSENSDNFFDWLLLRAFDDV
jgi:hypothetical protein